MAQTPPPTVSPTTVTVPAFAQRFNELSNGVVARHVAFKSANPASYEDIIAGRNGPEVTLEAKLYLPKSTAGKVAAVIISPGSGGVNPGMVAHAGALTDAGIAVLLVDPFGGRGVRDTISAQDQFSFAASTFDIFAGARFLRNEAAIDEKRIGAMGYSRGGISVLQAAVKALAAPALGGGAPLRAVLAGWPWCGYQFAEPDTVPTSVRFIVADSDDYVSVPQCQAYGTAMRAKNPDVSIRLVRDARHGFGYGNPLIARPEAIKALNAPIVYFDARGVFLDPWSGTPTPGIDDRAVLKMMTPFVTRGVNVGSKDGQMQDFVTDMVAYFSQKLR